MAETKEVPGPVLPPKKRKYTRRAKRGPGRPKGVGTKKRRGRPKGTKAGTGLIGTLVAKQVKLALKAEKAELKALVKGLVSKEVKKVLKALLK